MNLSDVYIKLLKKRYFDFILTDFSCGLVAPFHGNCKLCGMPCIFYYFVFLELFTPTKNLRVLKE